MKNNLKHKVRTSRENKNKSRLKTRKAYVNILVESTRKCHCVHMKAAPDCSIRDRQFDFCGSRIMHGTFVNKFNTKRNVLRNSFNYFTPLKLALFTAIKVSDAIVSGENFAFFIFHPWRDWYEIRHKTGYMTFEYGAVATQHSLIHDIYRIGLRNDYKAGKHVK